MNKIEPTGFMAEFDTKAKEGQEKGITRYTWLKALFEAWCGDGMQVRLSGQKETVTISRKQADAFLFRNLGIHSEGLSDKQIAKKLNEVASHTAKSSAEQSLKLVGRSKGEVCGTIEELSYFIATLQNIGVNVATPETWAKWTKDDGTIAIPARVLNSALAASTNLDIKKLLDIPEAKQLPELKKEAVQLQQHHDDLVAKKAATIAKGHKEFKAKAPISDAELKRLEGMDLAKPQRKIVKAPQEPVQSAQERKSEMQKTIQEWKAKYPTAKKAPATAEERLETSKAGYKEAEAIKLSKDDAQSSIVSLKHNEKIAAVMNDPNALSGNVKQMARILLKKITGFTDTTMKGSEARNRYIDKVDELASRGSKEFAYLVDLCVKTGDFKSHELERLGVRK